MMDHRLIEAEAVVERYVTGRLTDEESLQFEEHFLDCAQCIENVEITERLQRGLGGALSEIPRETPAPHPPAELPSRQAPNWMRLGMAAALLISLGLGLFFRRDAIRLRHDLDRAHTELARVLSESTQTRDGLESSDRSLFQIQQNLEQERQKRLEAEGTRDAEASKGDELTRRLAAWKQPAGNLPLALLTPLRGSEDRFPIALPRNGRWTGLWVELGGESLSTYRAELRSPDRELRWSDEGLQLNALGALFILLPTDLLSTGAWELSVQGRRSPDDPLLPLATFPLSIEAD